jgi:hypothetical protein
MGNIRISAQRSDRIGDLGSRVVLVFHELIIILSLEPVKPMV